MGLSMHDAATSRTKVERTSDVDMVVRRTFDAPAHLVFRAWSDAALFRRWWVPASAPVRLRTCEMDVRTGGSYRLEFGEDEGPVHAFFGRYVEVIPDAKIVWTNEESDDGAPSRRPTARRWSPITTGMDRRSRSTKPSRGWRAASPSSSTSSRRWSRGDNT